MKTYVIHNDAITELGLTDNLKGLSVITSSLTNAQVEKLSKKGIPFHEEETTKPVLLGGDYEKIRSHWKKNNYKGLTGAGCKVAVIDTSFNTTVSNPFATYNAITGSSDVSGTHWHGTRVSSTIKSNIGMANGCELHLIKMIPDSGFLSESSFLNAINYCITNNIDVVNLSWQTYFDSMPGAIISLVNANCIPVAAAGNDTIESPISIPAGLPECVAVNAVDENGDIVYKNTIVSGYATHGITIACSGIAAEGINVSGNYGPGWGTSFSAPFFCAAFALYKQELGIVDNRKVLQHILNKAIKVNPTNDYGVGLLTF